MVVGEARYRIFETPAGAFTLIADPDGALSATWDEGLPLGGAVHDQTLLPGLSVQLEHYFDGEAKRTSRCHPDQRGKSADRLTVLLQVAGDISQFSS